MSAAGWLQRLQALPAAERRDLFQAAWRLPLIHLCLRVLGLRRTQRLMGRARARRGAASSTTGKPTASDWQRRARALRRTGARLPGVHCLSRSLCLWCWMRRYGLDPDLRIGVRRADSGAIESHSWVELDGVPIDETPEVVAGFQVVDQGNGGLDRRFRAP